MRLWVSVWVLVHAISIVTSIIINVNEAANQLYHENPSFHCMLIEPEPPYRVHYALSTYNYI